MAKVKIDANRCKGCRVCTIYCPGGCIKIGKALNKKGIYPVVFTEEDGKCTGCTFCALMCPDACIEIEK